LFDTADSWDVSYVLSGDADYVPAVSALRRRGKVVIGAGFASPSSALVREAYFYHDLASDFIRDDFVAFRLFGAGGLVHQWLQSEVKAPENPKDPTAAVGLTVHAQYFGHRNWTESDYTLNLAEAGEVGPRHQIYFLHDGPIDVSERSAAFEEFRLSFPEYCPRVKARGARHKAVVSILAWNGFTRRLSDFIAANPQVSVVRHGDTDLRLSTKFDSPVEGQ
jgi:hypothetical protein